MSTKEMLLHEIDAMNETQMQGLLLFIRGCYNYELISRTLSLFEDVENGVNLKGPFSSVKELMEDLNAED